MANAHHKPCRVLETPKAPSATKATILGDEGMATGKPEMDNQQVTREEIGWLAGFIDGEGYLGISMYRNRSHSSSKTVKVELNVVNTDEEMIDKYVAIMNKLGSNPYLKKAKKYKKYNGSRKKEAYVATIHRMSPLYRVLKVILPYLTGMKKKRGELINEFLASRLWKLDRCKGGAIAYTEREIEIIQECLKLQKRGTSETIRKAELEAHQRKAMDSIESKCKMAAKMLKLRAKGWSFKKIARECGFSSNPNTNSGGSIGWWIRRLYKNETPIQILGYFPKNPSASFEDIVRPYVKA